ncbi:acetylornithine transaminase [Caryophanon tenue]|uniref:Acetylornithine aminotransferase n=1 Tax=Caryophanon tenue TaxID=33978 RepID=A0A1C0YMD8_9BACL|nr:acetylornithine transaminase [Caryophanon tenue]OCS88318.1 acetylornithine aminotransferase [Caryophanon tenue]
MGALFGNYARRPIALVKGQGTHVWDEDGKEYLDFTSGIAVLSLGHAHPALVDAITQQANTIWHTSNLFASPGQEALAQKLVADTHLAHAFFCNSGAEANEAAIKMARKHTGKHHIITFEKSFHGRTFGAMSATGQDKVQQGFGPLVSQFTHLPYNDVEALKATADDSVAAIMLEVIQGEGGLAQITPEFADAIMELCNEKGILLIVDEVQTGIGRTGTRYAFEQTSLKPHLVSLAKGLGGGYPIGGLLGVADIYDTFSAGSHGTTFGGNPLGVSVAQTVLQHVFDEAFLADVQAKGTYLQQTLAKALPADTFSILGQGLMVGIHCGGEEVAHYIPKLEEAGVLLVAAGPYVLRVLPPLTVTTAEIDEAVACIAAVLTASHVS